MYLVGPGHFYIFRLLSAYRVTLPPGFMFAKVWVSCLRFWMGVAFLVLLACLLS